MNLPIKGRLNYSKYKHSVVRVRLTLRWTLRQWLFARCFIMAFMGGYCIICKKFKSHMVAAWSRVP